MFIALSDEVKKNYEREDGMGFTQDIITCHVKCNRMKKDE